MTASSASTATGHVPVAVPASTQRQDPPSSTLGNGSWRDRLGRIHRGPAGDPAWGRPALLVLLAATAVLYLWNLSSSGYANDFYAAAAQAGSLNWKAWFFGSFDPSNFITVDKPPVSLWAMGISGRIFGFSSFSMLLPQALEGVAAVGILYAAVRRWSGVPAGLLAGAALALTPAAAMMFTFNNPDAMLVLLLVAGAYAVVRAVEVASLRWLVFAGTLVGFAFLTKMLQGFLVIPAFALVYLVAAPTGLGRRIWHAVAAAAAVIVSAGWWVAIVTLWPASSRPYIGGSQHNSILELVIGYNGLARITGDSQGTGGGGPGGGGFGGGNSMFGGTAGLFRLFHDEMGVEVSWLLPAALIALVAGLLVTARAPRTDRTRAALLLWGGWTIVTGGVFSYMEGIVHPYYTVALAPGIAALVAVGGAALWHQRAAIEARIGLVLMVAVSGIWSYELLSRNADWHPALRHAVLLVTLAATIVVLATGVLDAGQLATRWVQRLLGGFLAAGLVAGLGGSAAYAVATAGQPHTGSIPTVGPASAAGAGGGRGFGIGGFGGGAGGSASTDSALTTLLQATSTRWAAAAISSQTAGPLQLASGKAVMSIGGFSGSDPAPTLAQFQKYVAAGQISYFVTGSRGGFGGGGGRGGNSAITQWVESTYTATTVGGQTVYDLRQT